MGSHTNTPPQFADAMLTDFAEHGDTIRKWLEAYWHCREFERQARVAMCVHDEFRYGKERCPDCGVAKADWEDNVQGYRDALAVHNERTQPGIIADPKLSMAFLTGRCGGGKTRALFAIMRADGELARASKVWGGCEYLRLPHLVLQLQQMMGADSADCVGEVDRLSAAETLLLLDDLGAGKMTPWAIGIVGEIIDERQAGGRRTVVTSNLGLDQISDQYDDRIASRLAGGTVWEFKGKDHRIKGDE